MDPELVDQLLKLIAAAGIVAFGGVKGGERIGWIERTDKNPALTAVMQQLSNTMNKVNESSEKTAEILVVVEERSGETVEGIRVLRGQLGKPAAQGEWEDWKTSPEERKNWKDIRSLLEADAFMAEISLKLLIAQVEDKELKGTDPREFLNSARTALERYQTVINKLKE